MNGRTLRGLGRSTAKEYWNNKATRNVIKLCKRTGDFATAAENSYTTFWVMQSRIVKGVLPADALIDPALAEDGKSHDLYV